MNECRRTVYRDRLCVILNIFTLLLESRRIHSLAKGDSAGRKFIKSKTLIYSMDMIENLKESLWTQFGASIDMLGNAISVVDEEFNENKRFFYVAYHSLVFLDYYLTIPPDNFSSPLPFTTNDDAIVPPEAVDDVLPNRMYTKKEMLDYLQSSRRKALALISSLTEEKLKERFIEDHGEGSMNYSILEIVLYNMRHVQHHTAQLNMMLRQEKGSAPEWVFRAAVTFKLFG